VFITTQRATPRLSPRYATRGPESLLTGVEWKDTLFIQRIAGPLASIGGFRPTRVRAEKLNSDFGGNF